MSGECDTCGEHAVDCRCNEMKLRDDVDFIEDAITNINERIRDLEDKVAKPEWEYIGAALSACIGKQKELFEKLEDNTKRVNSMLLELKGMVAMTRSFWKGTVAVKKIEDFLEDLSDTIKDKN